MRKWESRNQARSDGFWDPRNVGDTIKGVLVRFVEGAFPFFVFRVTGERVLVRTQDNNTKWIETGGLVGVGRNYQLEGLEEMIDHEVRIVYQGSTPTKTKGRKVKQLEITVSEDPVNGQSEDDSLPF